MTARSVVAVMVLVFLPWGHALAQGLGTFRWQLAPHCNVLTVDVERKGSLYELIGYDDQCGQGQPVTLSGVAVQFNPYIVQMSAAITAPNGTVSGLRAVIVVSSLSGDWWDEYGNTGDARFNPVLPAGGTPRVLRAPRAPTFSGSFATRFTARPFVRIRGGEDERHVGVCWRSATCGLTDRSGAVVYVTAAAPGPVVSTGTWALTPVP
jgi:hypothetical protein